MLTSQLLLLKTSMKRAQKEMWLFSMNTTQWFRNGPTCLGSKASVVFGIWKERRYLLSLQLRPLLSRESFRILSPGRQWWSSRVSMRWWMEYLRSKMLLFNQWFLKKHWSRKLWIFSLPNLIQSLSSLFIMMTSLSF